ncbi:Shedu immune nuclease family protein [Bifidobacterium samirii]|uniref:Shedu protein SduA C-terminal domain-containing protein n=1 Tax=Bifidobacterium samirii TaxID=2306974 RepID=A0A430FVL9_9BIFI|nr:Shedu immune nuclease family protein [Bifidobacterium samirii]RSX58049.1 hypothetical protein D2E24_0409 [Bifidobacterium samirii]
MTIRFERRDDKLVLIYWPEFMTAEEILDKLRDEGVWHIKTCFHITEKHIIYSDDADELLFCVGEVGVEYTRIDKDVFGVDHDFYFSNSFNLYERHFVASRNVCILPKIDRVINSDVYIGGSAKECCIPKNDYEFLIKNFPKTAELNRYVNARIASIVEEFFPLVNYHEEKFDAILRRKNKALSDRFSRKKTLFQKRLDDERDRIDEIQEEFENILSQEEVVSEEEWQEKVYSILRLLYPKYIAGIREVRIDGVDRNDKRPDFVLVDANGYLDVLEIKKANVKILTEQPSYRNNYIPVRELAGAVQQMEKYLQCLNALEKTGKKKLCEQMYDFLPDAIEVKILNPQGLLLLGRSKDFNERQKNDFELIKRQYKNIVEIMTYDDLLQRIKNISAALHHEPQNSSGSTR